MPVRRSTSKPATATPAVSRPILDEGETEFVQVDDGDDSPIVRTAEERDEERDEARVLPSLSKRRVKRRVLELSAKGMYRVLKVFRVDAPKDAADQTPTWHKPGNGNEIVKLDRETAMLHLATEAVEAA